MNDFYFSLEKAKAMCMLGQYADVIPLLEKQTGIYASHVNIFAYMKINRLDLAIKLLKKLTKSRGKEGLYIGKIEFPEVHQLFVEMSLISSLKRQLTNEEKEIIKNVIAKKSGSTLNSDFTKLVSNESKKLTLQLDVDELEKYINLLKILTLNPRNTCLLKNLESLLRT